MTFQLLDKQLDEELEAEKRGGSTCSQGQMRKTCKAKNKDSRKQKETEMEGEKYPRSRVGNETQRKPTIQTNSVANNVTQAGLLMVVRERCRWL